MMNKGPGLFSKIYFLNRLRLKLQIYWANRRVKACFDEEEPSKIPPLLLGGTAGTLVLFVVVWILSSGILISGRSQNKEPAPLKQAAEVAPVEVPTVPTTSKEEEKSTAPAKEEVPTQPVAPLPPKSKPAEKQTDKSVVAKPTKPEKPAEKPLYMKTRADLVNVRTDAFLESRILARLDAGYMVRVLGHKTDWVFSGIGGDHRGWIYSSLLEDVSGKAYEAWVKNPKRLSARRLIRQDLEDPEALKKEKMKIVKLLKLWKEAWENKDIETYISFYSKAFATSKHNWKSYKKYKEYIFGITKKISVDLSKIEVRWENNRLTASFVQKYRSSTISSTRKKLITFTEEDNEWKIFREAVTQG